jgi:hypothetical protein
VLSRDGGRRVGWLMLSGEDLLREVATAVLARPDAEAEAAALTSLAWTLSRLGYRDEHFFEWLAPAVLRSVRLLPVCAQQTWPRAARLH